MFLWIRSQDKESLILVKESIVLVRYGDEGGYQLNSLYDTLGIYETKERALEVLDEIQKLFSLKIVNETYKNADLFIKAAMLPIVYEMPEE